MADEKVTSVVSALKAAVDLDWISFKDCCRELKKVLGEIKYKETNIKNFEVDFIAQQLCPALELNEYVPVTTHGDGSCLFRSFSTLIMGDESRHSELRMRCTLELALYEEYYLADEDLAKRIQAQEAILTGRPSGTETMLGETFRTEVKNSINAGSYASFWHLQAMGNVLERKIRSVYPEITSEVSF